MRTRVQHQVLANVFTALALLALILFALRHPVGSPWGHWFLGATFGCLMTLSRVQAWLAVTAWRR